MIPVYPVDMIRKADAETIRRQGISSWQLMERAARACFDFLAENEPEAFEPASGQNPLAKPAESAGLAALPQPAETAEESCPQSIAEGKGIAGAECPGKRQASRCPKFVIFCGRGNNGGDGFALARMLKERGCPVEVWMPDKKEGRFSPDAGRNAQLMQETNVPSRIFGQDGLPEIRKEDILIDALVGTGLEGRLDEATAAVVEFINTCCGTKYSIDIPSGLMADKPTPRENPVVENSLCLSFQFAKKAFLWPENGGRPAGFVLLDIGLDEDFMRENPAEAYLLQDRDAARNLPRRPKFAHKGLFGRDLLIAGSLGMAGAAVLAGRAALKSGCGVLSIASCPDNRLVLQTAVPEALFIDQTQIDWAKLTFCSAIGIGPGIGTSEHAVRLLKNVLQFCQVPLVIDADGLNILARNPTLLEFLPKGRCILTPHLKEFERLAGKASGSPERLRRQQEFSDRYGAVVVLKGAHTSISQPHAPGIRATGGAIPGQALLFNTTGNPGMATGGSGDVLAGICLSLLGQGLPAWQAACTAVYLHGLAGDYAALHCTEHAMTAADIIASLPDAFRQISLQTHHDASIPGFAVFS